MVNSNIVHGLLPILVYNYSTFAQSEVKNCNKLNDKSKIKAKDSGSMSIAYFYTQMQEKKLASSVVLWSCQLIFLV